MGDLQRWPSARLAGPLASGSPPSPPWLRISTFSILSSSRNRYPYEWFIDTFYRYHACYNERPPSVIIEGIILKIRMMTRALPQSNAHIQPALMNLMTFECISGIPFTSGKPFIYYVFLTGCFDLLFGAKTFSVIGDVPMCSVPASQWLLR